MWQTRCRDFELWELDLPMISTAVCEISGDPREVLRPSTANVEEDFSMSDPGDAIRCPHFTLTLDGEILGEDTVENRAIPRRIRACVNACEELSTEELENGIVQDMRQVISSMAPLLADKKEALRNQLDASRSAPEAGQSSLVPFPSTQEPQPT